MVSYLTDMAIEHLPPEELTLDETSRLFFLAGPIQGAPDWQADAFNMIDSSLPGPNVHVANPRRIYMGDTFAYEDQVTWEDQGRLRATKNGAVIFWLAKQDFSLPYENPDREYGQTTRFEFAEVVMGWMRYKPHIHAVLGIEPGYEPNLRYYEHQARRFRLPVYDTLEATVKAALS